jgi:hypothetical protein
VLTSCSIIINSNTYLYQPPYSYQNPYFNLDIEKDLIRKEIKQIKKVKEKNQDIIPKTPIEQLEI